MIRRVRIQGYKSLQDIELYLQPLTIIFGPNAAGKSNLLDALGLVSRMVTSGSLKEAFEGHRGIPLEAFFYGDHGLPELLTEPTVEFSIEVDVELPDDVIETVEERIYQLREGLPGSEGGQERPRRRVIERLLRYRIKVQMLTEAGILRVMDERLAALTADGSREKDPHARKPFIYQADGHLLRLRMEGQSRPTEHELGLTYALASTQLYAPHYPHVTAFREELSRWRFYYLEPKSMRADAPLKEAHSLGPSGEDLAPLFYTLKNRSTKQFEAVNRALRTLIPSLEGIEVQRTNQGFLQLQVLEENIPFSARVISEGTLRVLGLLAITNPLSPTSVIGYEEPENGVHPRRLRIVAELLSSAASTGKQLIINTHSPKFPEFFARAYGQNATLVLCEKKGRATHFEPFEPQAGGMFLPQEVEAAMEAAERTSFADRVMRGDYGG